MNCNKGFIPLVIIIAATLIFLVGIGTYYVAVRNPELALPKSLEKTDKMQEELKTQDSKKEPQQNTAIPSQKSNKSSSQQQSQTSNAPIQNFVALEKELSEAKASGLFLLPNHEKRITADLDMLQQQGYSIEDINRLRSIVLELSPHLKDNTTVVVAKLTPSCISNANPQFTFDITDLSLLEMISPPPMELDGGQTLKTHAFLSIRNAGTAVPVYLPVDASLKDGSWYMESNPGGDYILNFQVSCEVTFRFDHITQPIKSIKDVFPNLKDDTKGQEAKTGLSFKAGDLIGMTTGTIYGKWDFGVYNSATKNKYASDPKWNWSDINTTAVCPFEYFNIDKRSAYTNIFGQINNQTPVTKDFCKF